MLKKTIKYTNPFTDEEVEEDFYFNISKAELVEMEMSTTGGLSDYLKRIVASEDTRKIMAEFKKIILTAYGKRSDDGRNFIKNQTLRDEFESSEAYSAFFMELITDNSEERMAAFVNGIIPKGLSEDVAALIASESADISEQEERTQLEAVPNEPDADTPEDEKPEPVIVTKADLEKMSQEELANLTLRISSGEVKVEDNSVI